MLIESVIGRTLCCAPRRTDLRLLNVLSDPRPFFHRDARPTPADLSYYRDEHAALLAFHLTDYTRGKPWWISWRASDPAPRWRFAGRGGD